MIPVLFVSGVTRSRQVSRWPLVLAALWMLLCVPLAYMDMQQRWIDPVRQSGMWFKLWLFWAAWAIIPLLWHAVLVLRRRRVRLIHTVADWMWLLMLLAAAWASLIEPRLLLVRTHQITVAVPADSVPVSEEQQAASAAAVSSAVQPLRVAVVADIHLGLFVRQWQLQRLVNRLNALELDAVLIPGDWVYEPHRNLTAEFAALRQLRVPVFGVLGNHDVGFPGMASLEAPLRAALQANGVQLLEGRVLDFKGWQLAGLGDLWGGAPKQDWHSLHGQWQAGRPRLLLAHQPDTAAVVDAGAMSLMVSGHTHGGQVWLPKVSEQWVLPQTSMHGWYNGLYATSAGQLFVTAGAGMVSLPVRFAVPPRIDVLTISARSAS